MFKLESLSSICFKIIYHRNLTFGTKYADQLDQSDHEVPLLEQPISLESSVSSATRVKGIVHR